MIINVTRSAQHLYHEFLFRIEKHKTPENISFETVLMYINSAIKELYTMLLPYKEFAYHTSLVISHNNIVPRNFYKPIRLICDSMNIATGVAPNIKQGLIEAKYVSPYEYYTFTNWHNKHSFNSATTVTPYYTIWNFGEYPINNGNALVPADMRIKIAPNADLRRPGLNLDISGVLEFYALPPDLIVPSDTMDLPIFYEEFVLNIAISRYMIKVLNLQVEDNHKTIKQLKADMLRKLQIVDYNLKRELDNFFEPTLPFRMVAPLPGELPKQLTK